MPGESAHSSACYSANHRHRHPCYTQASHSPPILPPSHSSLPLAARWPIWQGQSTHSLSAQPFPFIFPLSDFADDYCRWKLLILLFVSSERSFVKVSPRTFSLFFRRSRVLSVYGKHRQNNWKHQQELHWNRATVCTRTINLSTLNYT